MNSVAIRSTRRTARGFTLIELMIVVAVVAVLAPIAFPSYADSVRKSRRGQLKADLMEISQLAERWKTVNNTYVGFGSPAADCTLGGDLGKSPRTGTAYYTVCIVATATTFSLTGTPVSGTGQEKDACGALTITQAGVKTRAGSGDKCW